MITFCDGLGRKQALALWKQQATSFEVATLDIRFHHDWLESDVVAFMKDANMSAFIMEQKRTIKLGHHHVNVMLVPWCVKDDVQDLTTLLKERLSMHAHQVLASIIISDDEVLMRSLKALPWITSQSVNLSKSMIEPLSFSMVTFELPLELVAKAYNGFMARFDSTLIRQVEDFNLPTHTHTSKRKRAGIIQDDRILGYMDYELTPYGVDVRELIYEDVDTLIRCLSFASSLHHHIVLHTSASERFEKLFPQANIMKKTESWMVLHHPSLCSELFKQSISASDDLARVLHKPLMMHTR
jgi:hypothetical protein